KRIDMRKIYFLNVCVLLVVAALGNGVYAQGTITGKVTEQRSGEPLAGVTVAEKHTSRSTMTDEAGAYSIEVGPNAILVFSYVGFPTLEEHVSDRSTVDIQLGGDDNMLDEVVAIGYASNRKQ